MLPYIIPFFMPDTHLHVLHGYEFPTPSFHTHSTHSAKRLCTGWSSGEKSILRALASFAAVRKVMLTSWWSTFVMYGRDTFIRFASSVCDTPSSFIRSRMRRRNAEPILSIAVIPFNQPSRHPQFLQPTLLTSRRTDLDPAIFLPQPDIPFHLRHSIIPLSTSFAPPHLHIYWNSIMRRNVICLYSPHQASIVASRQALSPTSYLRHRPALQVSQPQTRSSPNPSGSMTFIQAISIKVTSSVSHLTSRLIDPVPSEYWVFLQVLLL